MAENKFFSVAIGLLCSLLTTTALPFPFVSNQCFPDIAQHCDETFISSHLNTTLPNTSTLRFFLFTQENRENPEMLHLCKGTLPSDTRFDPRKKLVVFIPGYLFGICEQDLIKIELKNALLDEGDVNVLMVACRDEYGMNYLFAASFYVPRIAQQIAMVLKNMQDQTYFENSNVHLVGLSLGSHVAGIIANSFPVGRITGVDAAGPMFGQGTPRDNMLDSTDAPVVDVLHCNSGFFGLNYPIGTVDFFLDAGRKNKPTCTDRLSSRGMASNFWVYIGTGVLPGACEHYECLVYFVNSIKSGNNLVARGCDSYEAYQSGKCTTSAPSAVFGYKYRDLGLDNALRTAQKYYISVK